MKKFTQKFLLGERSFGSVLRKIGLSIVAILFTLAGFTKPPDPQETLHVWAENADDYCYRQDNDYEVDILIKDFVKIDTFVLVLDYTEPTVFSYTGFSDLHSVLDATGTFSITETTSGTLQIEWDSNDDPVNNGNIEPNNDTTVVVTLHFELDGYPHNYGVVTVPTFDMELEWDNSKCMYWNSYPGDVTNILTTNSFDGYLLVTQDIEDIVVETNMAGCADDAVLAVVTSPTGEGYEYQFNEGPWSSSPEAEVSAPYCCNTVKVRHGDCISYVKTFETKAPTPLDYSVKEDTVNTRCPDGSGVIEINATGGSTPYTYYVIPSSDTTQVKEDLVQAITAEEGNTVVEDYMTINNTNTPERPVGVYWVAVQDANNCIDLRDLSWWTQVVVEDDKDPWLVQVEAWDINCNGDDDGRFTLDISGATPFVDGYNIWVNDNWKGRTDEYDSNENSTPVLTAGTYDVHIADSLGCCWDSTIVLTEPLPIEFWVDHTDASCDTTNGTITIDTTSIVGGSGDLDDWWWIYSTSPDFEADYTDTIYVADGGIKTKADSLAPGVYYVTIFDANGCPAEFVNESGDNAIKILTTEFDLVYDDIACNGGTTDVSIVLTSGTGNHEFEYGYVNAPGDTIWQTSSNTFENIDAGIHTFIVHDITIDCMLVWNEEIPEPDELTADVVERLLTPPTCPGNTDGNLFIMAQGGTPFESEGGVEYYEYKLDNNSWEQFSEYATYAVDTANHEILVRDANGCTTTIMFDWFGHDWPQNYIEFQDTIWNMCPLEMVNLFNADPKDDYWWNWATFSGGYMTDFEWYGVPVEFFTGVLTRFDYSFWTSDSGWVERTVQGFQQLRYPKLYISDMDPEGNPQSIIDNGEYVDSTSAYGAGDYWLVAMDEWGCFSNIEKIVIVDPPEMEVIVSTEPAGCAGSTDGKIILKGFNAQWDIPYYSVRYQYVLTQQPQIFNQEDWWTHARWSDFTSGDFDNDSLAVINVQAGTYWISVRDYCGVENPDSLIQYFGPIEIEGADPIEVDWGIAEVTDVTCNTYGVEEGEWTEEPVPSDDGSITGLLAATTGGFGGYTFYLDWSDCRKGYSSGYDYTWPMESTTGDFTGLPAGCYTLTIIDSMDCQTVIDLEITQPDPFGAKVDVVYASCYEAHDGIMRYRFYGGTAPYEEATNNVGIWENPSDIPEERWYDVTSEADTVPGHDFIVFDRRVRAGHKQVWVRDANGCIFGPLEVVVDQPAELAITDVDVKNVSCNDQDELNEGELNDGCIYFSPVGGWNIEEEGEDYEFWYYAELWPDGATVASDTLIFNTLPVDTFFCGLSAGDYTIKLYEYSWDIEDEDYAGPIITEPGYFDDWHTWIEFAPYQNPNLSKCFVEEEVTVGEPDPIVYDPIEWRDVKCHNDTTGQIYVPNITGGTPSLVDGYYVGLEGPADYDPLLQSNYSTHYADVYGGITWFKTGAGVNEFTFDNLIWGHYTVHIADSAGCWIYKESGEIENPDTLMIEVVELVEQATCYGGDGIIQIDATGGVGEYMYAVDSTLVPHPGSHAFPNDLDLSEYLENLPWQESDTFNVTAATWIGYVMDENGCVVGFATRKDGSSIYHHRVTVLEPDPIEAVQFAQMPATCYGYSDGEIWIGDVWGGNGQPWMIDVTGTDYEGNPIDTSYVRSSSSNLVLGGLPASTNLTPEEEEDMTADDKYTIVISDVANCISEEFHQYVTHPEEFKVVLKDKQNAFVCPNDQAGIFEIEVVKGGTPWIVNGDTLYQYKWEAYEDEGYSMLIDSLSDDTYGFVETFLGYADIYYTVYARDFNGCETSRDTFIQAPDPVVIDTKDITCYGDELGSARVWATGEEGRSFKVLYKEVLNGVVDEDWTEYNGWFTDSIDVEEEFKYCNDDLQCRHYLIAAMDTMGCMSEIDTMVFYKVQNDLMVEATLEGNEITAEASGGAVDEELNHHYQFALSVVGEEPNPVWQDENIFIVDEYNEYVVWARDYNLCLATDTVTGGFSSYTIAEIQGEVDSSLVTGEIVKVSGTVTGVVDGHGFYMQDANTAWSGIWVAVSEGPEDIAIGDGVTVVGEVAEIDHVTTIVAMGGEIIEPPVTIEPILLGSPSEAIDEMYESVLVKVGGARATAADEGTGQWTIYYETSDSVVVDKLMYTYVPTEDNYYDVTGVTNGMNDAFMMEPRMEEDIVDLTETTPAALNPNNVAFKVYPNPFRNYIYIDNYDKLTRVVISNIAGQRVLDVEYPSREVRTDNLVSGVYVVSMFTENGRAKTQRIVKW